MNTSRRHATVIGIVLGAGIALSLVVIVAMVWLVIDGGYAWGQQRKTQNGADSMAEAGAAVLAAIRRSVNGFDRRCVRTITPGALPAQEGKSGRVALGAARDQRVQPVLGREGLGGVGSAAGESGNSPVGSIGCVGCVPGLMGAVEVAQAEVNETNRWRYRETEQ